METNLQFWQTFFGVIIKPLSTLRVLQEDDRPALKGWLALFLVLSTYTLILIIFIARDYPAAAPSILPIGVEDLYRYQVWYQGPLFIVATFLLSGILHLLSLAKDQTGNFPAVFARVSFATTVPFALTTMAIELVIAILVLARVFQPQEILGWLTGDGALFANVYQIAALVWVFVLLVITAKLSVQVKWPLGIALGVILAIIYGVPIGLFVR
jgi:hypothetical protein